MSLLEIVGFVASAFAILGVIAAIVQIFLTQANERRRTQGIVIAHETRSRHFAQGSGWKVEVHLTNEGQGPAFNVRLGVSLYGIRYPFRLQEYDRLSGNRQRVVRTHQRLPERGGFPIPISSLALAGRGDEKEELTFYWARYEDALGRTYETENPPDRSAELKIRRVRFVRIREGWNARKHRQADDSGIRWEKRVRAEFRQRRAEAEADGDVGE